MRKKKSGAKPTTPAKAKPAAVALVPQPHGGAIKTGGNPGNRGGGRTPSELRRRLREAAADRVEILEEIADGIVKIPVVGVCEKCGHQHSAEKMGIKDIIEKAVSANDRKQAIDTLLKYGVGTQDEISVVSPDVMARLEAQASRFVAELEADALAIVKAITDEVWQ